MRKAGTLIAETLAGGFLLIMAGAALADDSRVVDGSEISVTGDGMGTATLLVDGAVLHENGVIYLDPEPVVLDGVKLITGAAGAGGNACNAAPFVLALPTGAPPEFWGPVDSCAYFTPKVEGGKLVFTSDAMAGAPGETWAFSREGGFAPGPAVGFTSTAGWQALDTLSAAHPADALAIAPVMMALQDGIGANYAEYIERITGLGAGDLIDTGYLGSACIKLSCETDWAILYLHRETEGVFAIWHVYGEIENHIFPQDTTIWPPEAMIFLRDRAGE